MPVVDASVWSALFIPDDAGHEASRRWITEAEELEEPIASPVILLAEVASALGRSLDEEDLAREAVAFLRTNPLVELFHVTESLAARAAEIASEQKLRGCDAIYVALAKHLQMELVTLDRQQLERGAGVITTRKP
jgi:predicted nucleic acid-binding protein